MTALAELNADIRLRFPALARKLHGEQAVFFDGPAGTQVPDVVMEAIIRYLRECNANHGGVFETSLLSDEMLREAHEATAALVGTTDSDEIVFGPNMTSLTFALSRALSRTWQPGDEIVVTRLDHDANITPWVLAARDAGVVVRHVDFREHDCTLDLEQLQHLLNARTRLVAVGCASNVTGGIHPVERIVSMAHAHGTLVFLDAVHYAPHRLMDVEAWGADFLACSAYKFFGPHVGILWGRRHLLESLEAYKVRPAPNTLPGKWMTGTQSHEGIAGVLACVDYMASLGREMAEDEGLNRRAAVRRFFEEVSAYERELSSRFLAAAAEVEGLKVYGITDVDRLEDRCPTFSVTHSRVRSSELARRLARAGIFAWHGNYYAVDFHSRLSLDPEGTVRLGMVHYNNHGEIERAMDVLRSL